MHLSVLGPDVANNLVLDRLRIYCLTDPSSYILKPYGSE